MIAITLTSKYVKRLCDTYLPCNQDSLYCADIMPDTVLPTGEISVQCHALRSNAIINCCRPRKHPSPKTHAGSIPRVTRCLYSPPFGGAGLNCCGLRVGTLEGPLIPGLLGSAGAAGPFRTLGVFGGLGKLSLRTFCVRVI